MEKIEYMKSSENSCWTRGNILSDSYEDTLELTENYKQVIKGFGGCFNEMGWDVLKSLPQKQQTAILDELFLKSGCAFNMGRLPIGANDYALEWYSYDETDGDFDLSDFSIERDRKYLLPYLKEALKRCPEMSLFASPWSPPTWMKTKKVYNYGTLKWEEKYLQAYADYFVKYVQAYQNEGITIEQVHVQNEPVADQKFPSCMWTGEELRDFIKRYLGPTLKKSGSNTELWLGTLNGPFYDFMIGNTTPFSQFYDQYVNTVLMDRDARKYLTGAGFQWGGKHVLELAQMSYPELRYMQTENECGDGENTWEHAEYVFGLFWFYLQHGVESYNYWNMVLPQGGISTWGWKQNSLITVNPETQEVVYCPEFYVMKHFSHFIKPGARLIETKGHWTSNSVVFRNPDGEIIAVVGNCSNNTREFTLINGETSFSAMIEPHSFNTFRIQ